MRRMTAAVAAVLAVGVLGYPVLDALDMAPGVLTSDWSRGSAVPKTEVVQAAHPLGQAGGGAAADGAGQIHEPVLDPKAPVPIPAVLAARLKPLLEAPVLGAAPGAMVVDAATGKPLLTIRADVPRTPASTAKVLTAAAVAVQTDLKASRHTRVLAGAAPNTLVLVADGDTLLARGKGNPYATAGHAGLADLAAATAKALGAQTARPGQQAKGPYTLLLDDRIAPGPPLAPAWERVDVAAGLTGPVTMIGLTDDRALPGKPASADPAMTAAIAFREALRQAKIPVNDAVTRLPARGAPKQGAELAQVASAPVSDMLTLALAESDNALTEVVARRAFAGREVAPTFEGAGGFVVQTLQTLGVPTERLTLRDTSGLTRGSTASVRTITATTELAARGTLPEFTRVIAGLPVAGLSGTLFDRFEAPAASAGRGVVRGKSGTLTGVGGLTGTVVNTSGRLLVYTVLADAAPAGATLATRAALDAVVAEIAACRCDTPDPSASVRGIPNPLQASEAVR